LGIALRRTFVNAFNALLYVVLLQTCWATWNSNHKNIIKVASVAHRAIFGPDCANACTNAAGAEGGGGGGRRRAYAAMARASAAAARAGAAMVAGTERQNPGRAGTSPGERALLECSLSKNTQHVMGLMMACYGDRLEIAWESIGNHLEIIGGNQ
jgi:hypothetical protein